MNTKMESPSDTQWLSRTHCAYSPSGSVDSGVDLSPSQSLDFYDEFGLFSGGSSSPEGSLMSNVSPQHYNLNYESDASLAPNQLTRDDLDVLSNCSLSPASADHQINSFEDIGIMCNQGQQQLTAGFPNGDSRLASSDNTQRRRQKQKERDSDLQKAHPNLHPCLVPKSGTSKPRQSRKRRKSPSGEPISTGQGNMSGSGKPCYLGARVKKTAKERLEELRKHRGQTTNQQTEMPDRSFESTLSSPDEFTPKRRCSRVITPEVGYGAHEVSPTPTPLYNHSVQQILGNMPPRVYVRDDLEICIEVLLVRRDPAPLQEYAQQRACAGYADGGDISPLQVMLGKLHEKKDRYRVDDIQLIAGIMCAAASEYVNSANFDGETPIYKAALHGNEGVVLALMNYNANPWLPEKKAGQSALHAAVRSKRIGVVEAILNNHKGDLIGWTFGVNCADNDGNTPLHIASAMTDVDADLKRDLIRKLLQCGADTAKKNNMSQMPHSFLDHTLKDLQAEMKRYSQRKKSTPAAAPIPPQPAQCRRSHPAPFTPYRPRAPPASTQFNAPSHNIQPFVYAPPQYDATRYTQIPAPRANFAQIDPYQRAAQPGAYGYRHAPAPAHPNTAELDDIFHGLI